MICCLQPLFQRRIDVIRSKQRIPKFNRKLLLTGRNRIHLTQNLGG
jgi:hypothetical protein